MRLTKVLSAASFTSNIGTNSHFILSVREEVSLCFSSVQFSSVTWSCLSLCNPMECSMLGLPVYHQLLEFTQTHVHLVSDATIQPSHPLSSPSPPASNPSQHQGLFQWVNSSWSGQSIGVSASALVLPMNTQDWSPLGWTGWISLQSKRLSRAFSKKKESFPTPQFKSINSSEHKN